MLPLWTALLRSSLPTDILAGTSYSVRVERKADLSRCLLRAFWTRRLVIREVLLCWKNAWEKTSGTWGRDAWRAYVG